MSETKVYPFDAKVLAIHKLRVNVKSLAAEAKIIRKEARRCGIQYEGALTMHRRGRLREEARLAQLALAFFRGRTYRSAERAAKVAINPVALGKKLNAFGWPGYTPKDLETIKDWLK